MLARALAKPANMLVLDEPTNDLDLETLDLLQEMLAAFEGTLLLVSHDRDFIDRVVTSVLASDGDGAWTEYAGGYSDMVAQRAAAAPERQSSVRGGRALTASTSSAQATSSGSKRKMTFKEKHALETLPKEIEALGCELATLEKIIADPALYTRDRALFDTTGTKIATARAKQAAAEDRWLELEVLKGELEGG
jgi:ABC transport system ATP-binding/permease protein